MVLIKKKLLVLSLYYHPDIGPGPTRVKSIIETLNKNKFSEINLITSYPFRYPDYKLPFDNLKILNKLTSKNYDLYKFGNLKIYRVKLKQHKNTMSSQIFSYLKFFYYVLVISKKIKPNLIFATSGRLMTAFLAYLVSIIHKSKLIVEFRDIFSFGIKNHNFFKIKILNIIFSKLFFYIEKFILNKSVKVNFVSEDFKNYFNVNFNNKFKFYPNGIDEEFLNFNFKKKTKGLSNILYIGNIGEAQNLHNFLPNFSTYLKKNIQIKVIGSGGGKKALLKNITANKIKNIKVFDPIPKIELLSLYKNADILLLNLADKEVFESVIPSKIYEYIIINKPVMIGCKGEVEKFTKYSNNLFFFNPSDAISAVEALEKIIKNKKKNITTDDFKKKFSRKNISKRIVNDIYKCLY